MIGVIYWLETSEISVRVTVNRIDMFLLVLSTVMIAAAGNIINDYFDVKADRINKPEKLIITKHIKRRWAIISHWSLNGVAFLIGIYLSVKYDSASFALIHLISINLLWFYSMILKRKVLIGNLAIAFLTSLIPILALIFYTKSRSDISIFSSEFVLIHILSVFAFLQNFAREIIKDIQDMEGDKLIYVRSLPMVIGIAKTRVIITMILLILPFALLFSGWVESFLSTNYFNGNILFYIAGGFNVLVIILLFMKGDRYKLQDKIIKLSMLAGILSLYI